MSAGERYAGPTPDETLEESSSAEVLMGGTCAKNDGGPHDPVKGKFGYYCRKCAENINAPTAAVPINLPITQFRPEEGWMEMRRIPEAAHVRRVRTPVIINGERSLRAGDYLVVSEDGRTATGFSPETLRSIYEPATPVPVAVPILMLTEDQKTAVYAELDALKREADAVFTARQQQLEARIESLRHAVLETPVAPPRYGCEFCGSVWPDLDSKRAENHLFHHLFPGLARPQGAGPGA